MKKYFCICCLVIFSLSVISGQNQVDTISLSTQNIAQKKSTVVKVVDWYMTHLNYYTVTLLMTIESSFIPFPSEVIIPPAAYAACNAEHDRLYVTDYKFINIALIVLFGTLGSLIGALVNYFLSLFLGRPIIYKFADSKLGHLLLLNSSKIKKAEDYFVKHGKSSTFVGRLIPGIRQLISIPAGLAKMKLLPFMLYTCLGAALWNIVLAILGYIAHGEQDIINKYSHELSYIVLGLGVLFAIHIVHKGLKNKKNKNVA